MGDKSVPIISVVGYASAISRAHTPVPVPMSRTRCWGVPEVPLVVAGLFMGARWRSPPVSSLKRWCIKARRSCSSSSFGIGYWPGR
jgi:hypothetical protein